MEINGIAHVQLSVNRFAECKAFYDRLMPYLGLQTISDSERAVYYVGGRTGLRISPAEPEYAGEPHSPGRSGLHHLCFRARSREDVDDLYVFLRDLGATIVRAPEEGPWAAGYYSLSFLDPDGIRLEVNYVPGKGVFAEGASFEEAPDYPVSGRRQSGSVRTAPAGSDESVEIVRRIYAGWARGDMRAGVDVFDPEITFESFMPDSSRRIVCRNPGEVEAFMREFLAQWRDYRILGDEFQAVQRDKVFVKGRQAGTGRHSGVAVEGPIFSIWTFQGGKVVRLVFEPDLVHALEAAGLSA